LLKMTASAVNRPIKPPVFVSRLIAGLQALGKAKCDLSAATQRISFERLQLSLPEMPC